MTLIRISSSSLREGRWYEYVIRFSLGGAATVFTGLVSSHHGASMGGLFLALPAGFCASATLIEKHEIRRKREAALAGERRGRYAAPLDAAGAALGAVGLLAFAVVFWSVVEESVPVAFMAASLVWLVVSVSAWYVRRKWPSVRLARNFEIVLFGVGALFFFRVAFPGCIGLLERAVIGALRRLCSWLWLSSQGSKPAFRKGS